MVYVYYTYRGSTVSRAIGAHCPTGLYSFARISGAHGPTYLTGARSHVHVICMYLMHIGVTQFHAHIGGSRSHGHHYLGYIVSCTYRGHTVPRGYTVSRTYVSGGARSHVHIGVIPVHAHIGGTRSHEHIYLYGLHRLTHISGAQGPMHVLGAHGPTSISRVSQSHAHIGGARSRAPFGSHEHIGGVGPALLLVSRAYRGCTVPCSSLRHTVSLLYRGHAAPHTFRGDSVSPISYSVTVSITVVVFHHALGWGCMPGILYVGSCYYSVYNSEVHSARRPRRVTDVLLRVLGLAIYVGMLALSHPPPLIPEVRVPHSPGAQGPTFVQGLGAFCPTALYVSWVTHAFTCRGYTVSLSYGYRGHTVPLARSVVGRDMAF